NQTDSGHHQDAEDPKIPCDEEGQEISKADFRPLIESAFEWRETIQVNNDGSEGQIESDDGDQPERHLRSAKRRGKTNPDCAENKDDLREDEVAQTKLFFERGAACFDITLDRGEICLSGCRHRMNACQKPDRKGGRLTRISNFNNS